MNQGKAIVALFIAAVHSHPQLIAGLDLYLASLVLEGGAGE